FEQFIGRCGLKSARIYDLKCAFAPSPFSVLTISGDAFFICDDRESTARHAVIESGFADVWTANNCDQRELFDLGVCVYLAVSPFEGGGVVCRCIVPVEIEELVVVAPRGFIIGVFTLTVLISFAKNVLVFFRKREMRIP